MNKFNLTFAEALEVLKDETKWVQGENFGEDVILCNEFGVIMARDLVMNLHHEPKLCVTLFSQKYRVVELED